MAPRKKSRYERNILELQPMRPVFFRSVWLIVLSAAFAVGQNAELIPQSQSVAPAIVTADSGIKSSGTGAGWSKWYRLGVGKAPKGYTVQKAEFWLTGARSCGVLAECRELLSKSFGNFDFKATAR
jgi:hypothetical protein